MAQNEPFFDISYKNYIITLVAEALTGAEHLRKNLIGPLSYNLIFRKLKSGRK